MVSSAHRLYLLFSPALAGEKPWRVLENALKGGVDLVQWRCKEPDDGGFRACRDVCMERGVPILVNDDVMLGVRGRAHGAHVGQDDMPAEVARKLLVRQWLGVSTHSKAQIDAAVAAGADYVGFGPCYPTATKGYTEGLTAEVIEEAAFSSPVPLFAIGGIDATNLLRLRAFGVRRIAVSSAILKAQDPYAAAARLRAML